MENFKVSVENFLEDQEIICVLQAAQSAETQINSRLLFPLYTFWHVLKAQKA